MDSADLQVVGSGRVSVGDHHVVLLHLEVVQHVFLQELPHSLFQLPLHQTLGHRLFVLELSAKVKRAMNVGAV